MAFVYFRGTSLYSLTVVRGGMTGALGRLRSNACFHFGIQPSVTCQHLGAPTEGR